MSRLHRRAGFTLVELMLALAFFSFILIFVLGGFLLITRNYNRGVTSTRIHQAGRNVMEEMVRELRQSSSVPSFYRLDVSTEASQAFICYSGGTYRAWDRAAAGNSNIGGLELSQVNLTPECIAKDEAGSGGEPGDIRNGFTSGKSTLNRDQVYVTNLELVPIGSGDDLFRLELSLATPNIVESSDLSQADSDGDGLRECSVATVGSEYCDVVSLSTVFSTR